MPRGAALPLALVLLVLVLDAGLIAVMEVRDRASDPAYQVQMPTPTPSATPTATTAPTTTVTATTGATPTQTTQPTLPPTTATAGACGLVLVNITTDRSSYCYQNDGTVYGQLLVRNGLDQPVNSSSLTLQLLQNKLSGVGAPVTQYYTRTEAELGTLSLEPGNSTYLNFSLNVAASVLSVGNYTLDAGLVLNGVDCGMMVSASYEVKDCAA